MKHDLCGKIKGSDPGWRKEHYEGREKITVELDHFSPLVLAQKVKEKRKLSVL